VPDAVFPRVRIQHHVGGSLVAERDVSQFVGGGIDDLVGLLRIGG